MKKVKGLAVILTVVLLLAACSGNQDVAGKKQNNAEGSPRNTEAQVVEFWYAIAGANGKVVESIVNEYNASQDQYRIKATYIPTNERMQQLSVAIASGKTPDLYTAGPPDVAALSGSNQLYSIDELAKNHEYKIDRSQFFDALQDLVVRDGQMYGVPISVGVTALYYNKDLFEANGLTRAPDTWEELIEYARKVTDPDKGQWGIILPTKEDVNTSRTWVTFLEQAGGQFLTDDGKQAAFNSEAGVKALQLWVDMFQKYKVAPLKLLGENEVVQEFGAGNSGMFFGHPVYVEQSKEFPFTVDVARSPKDQTRSSSLGGFYLTVPAKADNPQGAYEFLSWLIQPENAVKWNLGMGNLPTTQAAVDTQAYQAYLDKQPLIKTFTEALAEDAFAPPATAKFNQVLTPVVKAVVKAIYEKQTPQEALDQAAAEVNQILTEE